MPLDASDGFSSLNPGYNATFRPRHLTLGVVVPLESYPHADVPNMHAHLERLRRVDELGFAAVWLRDVPFHVPSFGDAGQLFDPFVYLGMAAAQTQRIALGVASVVLPLRHPAHVAKAAASVDVLSGGRLLLGVASGDRPQEFPALSVPFAQRGARFRESFSYIRHMGESWPRVSSPYGAPVDVDLLPKPYASRLPMLLTGGSQQSPEWIAAHGDGWMIYPRDLATQNSILDGWRRRVHDAGRPPQPVMQPLYVDLDDTCRRPRPLHLGFRLGVADLIAHLRALQDIGVHHVALNLRFNRADVEDTLETLAREVLPHFPSA